jgi:Tol biopolymer transport system component
MGLESLKVTKVGHFLAAMAWIAVFAAAAPLRAELRVDITQGSVEPLPVAINTFFGSTEGDSKTGRDLAPRRRIGGAWLTSSPMRSTSA